MDSAKSLLLGCVADDFTGASDAASFLAESGMQTVLISGIPDEREVLPVHIQAVVIALKTRTMKKEQAVRESMTAFDWLHKRGAEILYFKYCSTFDSTREGNIGPVADALLDTYDVPFTIICPALPVNGRVIHDGKLLVNGIPLHLTHMKDHPLTPMRDSRIKELLEPQSRYQAFNLSIEQMKNHAGEVRRQADELSSEHGHFYFIPDLYEENHARLVVSLFSDLKVWTGGSGLMAALTEKLLAESGIETHADRRDRTTGDAILLAGSCSKATLDQIIDFQAKGGASFKIDPADLAQGEGLIDRIWSLVEKNRPQPVLVYSSDHADVVATVQTTLGRSIADQLERLFARLAEKAIQNSISRIIVAGGETSGSVTQALRYRAFLLGSSIAPGVPILTPIGHPGIRLVLKSGNFGQVDFFTRALDKTGG